MNEKSIPAFWWVNQGSTYDEAQKGGFIWAPKEDKAGRRLYHWENISKVSKGDFIFHYANGKLRAISRAKSNGYDAKKELGGSEWSDDGWRVDTDYCLLTKAIPIEEIGARLAALQMDRGPVNRSGGVIQGYLFQLPAPAVSLLVKTIGDDPALQASGIAEVIKVDDDDGDDGDEATLTELSDKLLTDLEISAVRADEMLVRRFVSASLSKRFIILSGLAGSGKTKLAQAFSRWITPEPGWIDGELHYKGKHLNPHIALVPVGADWMGNENILGYPDGLQDANYVYY